MPSPEVRYGAVDVSVVMPCLNEAETLAGCIRQAQAAIRAGGLRGEVVIADNGSSDGSIEIAVQLGARVVSVPEKGYGSALRGGITAARGRYIVMGDADGSYDFGTLAVFVARLRDGADLVMGNRFSGSIDRGAMPWSHRWIGNPALSALGRLFFRAPVGDFHCGLRAFTKAAYARMRLTSPGMEFASEMVIRARLEGLQVTEIPTVLSKDGRSRPPHLRTWRDGWRHLRFMLLYAPRWLFVVPGLTLLLAGTALTTWLLPGTRLVGSIGLDIHTMLVACAAVLVGFQAIVFGVFAEIFTIREGLRPASRTVRGFFRHIKLETGLLVGLLMLLASFAVIGYALWTWSSVRFGRLNPEDTMRLAIPAVTLLSLGVQTIFSSFFLSILGMPKPEAMERLVAEALAAEPDPEQRVDLLKL